jgi:hypothetical protein
MTVLTVSIDAARPLAILQNGAKRTAFAIVNALNFTAKEIQKGERARVAREFTVRKREFLMREAAVIRGAVGGSGFASVPKGRFDVRIAVGQKPRLLLSGFETGEERKPFRGKNVAVPITGGPARPTFGSTVPDPFTFRGLNLRRVTSRGQQKHKRRTKVKLGAHVTRSGKVQWKGAHRTFLLPETVKAPKGGVFQRVGPGRDDIRMVYSFAQPRRLDRRLRFIETGEAIARRVYAAALKHEVDKALAYNLLGVRL